MPHGGPFIRRRRPQDRNEEGKSKWWPSSAHWPPFVTGQKSFHLIGLQLSWGIDSSFASLWKTWAYQKGIFTQCQGLVGVLKPIMGLRLRWLGPLIPQASLLKRLSENPLGFVTLVSSGGGRSAGHRNRIPQFPWALSPGLAQWMFIEHLLHVRLWTS